MHQNFYQFDFELPNQEETDKLIAMLSEQGFDGFEEEGTTLISFIPEVSFKQESFEQVLENFSILSYTKTDIENINWNSKWEAEFEPVLVDKFVAVRAHFHQPIPTVQYEIIITPKMSFGTGHHATTYLVMQQMQLLDFTNKAVFDFGTGTGVLAILAEKLGAVTVFAIDNDEWSITNTIENIEQNHCRLVEVTQMDSVPKGKQYDIILANINLNVITASLPSLAAIAHPGSEILFSGFFKEDEPVMQDAIKNAGFQYIASAQRGDWIVMRAKKL